MNFWSEIVKEVGTVLVEVLVRIAEEMENNNFLYDLWVGSCHSLASDFSTIMKDLVEYDFIITESIMRERMQSA